MKGRVVVSGFWTRFFSAGRADAVTIFPFIFLRENRLQSDKILLNHEMIHIRQAYEMGVVLFYMWYLCEFVYRFIKHRAFRIAYLNISFEQEAYCNEDNLAYLEQRKAWSFWKYM